MKRGRLLCAAVMTAVAVALLAGYTAAGSLLPLERVAAAGAPRFTALRSEEPAAEAQPAPLPTEPPADALCVTVVDETGQTGRKLMLTDESGDRLRLTAPNRRQEYVLELSPGHGYTLTSMDGLSVTFFLEENASVTNVTGDGWTDGEVLHLDDQVRCTLRVVRTAGDAAAVYTLSGGAYCESRTLYCPEGETEGRAVFSGLLPGTYTLTGDDGTARTVELTERQPDVALGLD